MRKAIIIHLILLVCALKLPHAETIKLRDGSVIKGKLVRMSGDSLYFQTGFGSVLGFNRSQVSSLIFWEDVIKEYVSKQNSAAEPGSLQVTFNGLKLSNKVTVHRGKHIEDNLKANYLEESLYIDSEKVFSYIDSTMDKIISNGADKEYKNTIKLQDITVGLKPGPHWCRIVIRNPGVDFKANFSNKPFFMDLNMGDIIIYSKKTVRREVVVKKKKMGLAGRILKLRDQ